MRDLISLMLAAAMLLGMVGAGYIFAGTSHLVMEELHEQAAR